MKISTSGESHGKGLFAIIEGLPAGLVLNLSTVNAQLARRQGGYGRGGRQAIEKDSVEILTGVRNGVTLGSPVTLAVYNRDFENWKPYMDSEVCDTSSRTLTRVRPGHADLTGLKKFNQMDARNVLERASARETAIRVAVGEVCRQLLQQVGVTACGYVKSVGRVQDEKNYSFEEIIDKKSSVLGMIDGEAEQRACALIDEARNKGDTLGGVVELRVKGLKSGFGSCMTYAQKLDARLAGALMSVQAIKGVEVGAGFALSTLFGSEAHDEIFYDAQREFYRTSNRAGGIEGGMSNGEELVFRAAMKPIPTLMRGLRTVDYLSHEEVTAAPERSDACAITACEVVLESALLTELCTALLERLGGDNMQEIVERYQRLVK